VRQRGFVNLFPLVLTLGVLVAGAVLLKVAQTTTPSQQVLSSSNNDSSDSSGKDSSGLNSSDDEDSSGSSGSSQSTPKPTSTPKPISTPKPEDEKTEITTDSGVRIQTETKKDGGVRTEIKFGEEEKIKTKIEEGKTRVTVVSGGVKVRIERKEDRVVIKAEREDGQEVEVGEDEIVKIKQRLGGINIATAGAKLAIITNGIPAVSDFPLRIDTATNALSVVTPAGEKVVTVLPDQAVQNLIAANIIDRLSGAVVAANVATRSAITAVSQIINLGLEQGVPVYEIVGLKDHRLLGFIPVTTTVTSQVSAQTGQVVSTSQSFIDSVIDFFSVD